jgi:glycosyltransferase involved in cell wall biosynthesis
MPTAAVQVSMHPTEGLPATPADPRQLLIRVIEQLEAEGYYPVMACELEFYLLDQKRDAQGRPQPALDADGGRPRQTQVYGLRELEQIEPFLRDLYAACKAQGIPARTAISEYAPGQVEITLEHGPVLAAMDQAVRYKRLVKGVAHRHGMQACFMAKPFDHLADLYRGALALAYPSLWEGFGLPVLEAMACGTPVLTSFGSGTQEVAGDAALLVKPTDTGAIAEALAALASRPSLHDELRRRGLARAAGFSWKRTGAATRELLARG